MATLVSIAPYCTTFLGVEYLMDGITTTITRQEEAVKPRCSRQERRRRKWRRQRRRPRRRIRRERERKGEKKSLQNRNLHFPAWREGGGGTRSLWKVIATTQPPTVACKMESQLEHVHVFARLAPTWVLSRCLVTKFLLRSSVGSLLRVSCWLGRRTGEPWWARDGRLSYTFF